MRLNCFLIRFGMLFSLAATAMGASFSPAPGLFDPSAPDLGLKSAAGTRTAIVFSARPGTDAYANGVVPVGFKGRLYVQWQSSARDEDSPDTWVAYAASDDGEHWSAPAALAKPDAKDMKTSGGWWTDGKILVAYVNVWPEGFKTSDGRHPGGYAEYRTTSDGVHWSDPMRVTGKDGVPIEGIIEQDPHALPDGRIVTAFHLRPGVVAAPFYTDDPLGVAGWVRGKMQNLPHDGDIGRELEPSWFLRADGCLTMVFRDEGSRFRVLSAISCDRGATWSMPAETDMPDARAKLSAGNLPGTTQSVGEAYLVNAPSGKKSRVPLVLSLSPDGVCFDRAYLLRGADSLPPVRVEGLYKRPGFHYPKSTIFNGALYVGYSVNKEDVAITRVPLAGLLPTKP